MKTRNRFTKSLVLVALAVLVFAVPDVAMLGD